MKRGEIWWASLPEPRGSEPGYRRPVLVVQSNSFNDSAISTVLVVALTSNLHLRDAPGNVHLPRRTTGLRKDSVANVSQVLTLDKSFLLERISTLPADMMRKVETGLRLVMQL